MSLSAMISALSAHPKPL